MAAALGCSSSVGGTVGKVDIQAAYKGAETGDYSAVTTALENGLDVNKGDSDGKTLLHHAVIGNQTQIVMDLIEQYKADPNVKDKSGHTPLQYAIQAGNQRIAQMLQTEGAE